MAEKQWPAANGIAINPAFASMWMQFPNGNSSYHGMILGMRTRLSAGLQFQGAYSLSKMIDQGASQADGNGYVQNQRVSCYFDMEHRRGRSLLDIRNNFVSNLTYDVPRWSAHGVGGALLNGWQVNGILTLSDGTPSTSQTPVPCSGARCEWMQETGPTSFPAGTMIRCWVAPQCITT